MIQCMSRKNVENPMQKYLTNLHNKNIGIEWLPEFHQQFTVIHFRNCLHTMRLIPVLVLLTGAPFLWIIGSVTPNEPWWWLENGARFSVHCFNVQFISALTRATNFIPNNRIRVWLTVVKCCSHRKLFLVTQVKHLVTPLWWNREYK